MAKDTSHLEKLLSSHHTLVDDILAAVRNDAESGIKTKVIEEVATMKKDFDDLDELAKDFEQEKLDVSSSLTDTLSDY